MWARRGGVACAIAGVALVTAAWGCSSNPEPTPAEIAFADWPARLFDAACAEAVGCGIFADDATCRASTRVALDPLADDIAQGAVTYDPKAAGACLAELQAHGWLVECTRSTRTALVWPRPCLEMFSGAVATGGRCRIDEECAGKQCAQSGACGVCLPGPGIAAPAGGACVSTAHCAAGTYCELGNNPPSCTNRQPAGAPCGGSDECQAGTSCQRGPSSPRTCQRPAGLGQSCADAFCDPITTICDQTSSRCVPWTRPLTFQSSGGLSFCRLGFVCVGADTAPTPFDCPTP